MTLKKSDAQITYENVIKFPRFSYDDNIGMIPAGMQFYQKKSKFVSDFFEPVLLIWDIAHPILLFLLNVHNSISNFSFRTSSQDLSYKECLISCQWTFTTLFVISQ